MEKFESANEFIEAIKVIRNSIGNIYNRNNNIISILNNCCIINKNSGDGVVECDLYKLLGYNNEGFKTKLLVKILSATLGEDGYKDETLLKILSEGYGINNGKVMNKPISFDDLATLLNLYNEIVEDNNTNKDIKSKYGKIIHTMEVVVANKMAASIKITRETLFVINNFDKIIDGLTSNNKVELDNKDEFYRLINANLSVKKEDGTVYNDFSKKLESFISDYNQFINKYKEDKPYQNKLNKYYKKLTKTPFDKLEYNKFPKFEDEKFLRYMDDLASMIEEKIKDDESMVNLYAVLMLHKADYYKKKQSLK